MDAVQSELLMEFLYDTKGYHNSNYILNSDIRDEISIISTNLEEYIKYIKTEQSNTGITNATDISNITNTNIITHVESISNIIRDAFSGFSSSTMISSLVDINTTLRKLYSHITGDTTTKSIGVTQTVTDSNIANNIGNMVNVINMVDKSYVKKVTIFNKSLKSITSTFRQSFSTEDLQKITINSNAFVNFLSNYIKTFSNLDTKKIDRRKISSLLNTFKVFEQISIEESSIEKAQQLFSLMDVYSSNVENFTNRIRRVKLPRKGRVDAITNTIGNFVKNMNEVLKGTNMKRANDIANVLGIMGDGVGKFAKRLFWSSPMLLFATPGIAMFKLTMKFLTPQFNYLAENGEKLLVGAKALRNIGIGILAFSGSLFLSTRIFESIEINQAVGSIISIIGTGYLLSKFYNYIGGYYEGIKNGAKSIGLISVANVAMMASMYVISAVKLDYANVAINLLTTGLLVTFYNFVGSKTTSKKIQSASLSIGLMGLSLMAISGAIAMSSAILSANGNVIWQLPVLLGGLSLVYGVAGKFWQNIGMGALMMAGIGASLYLLADPMTKIATVLSEHGDVLWKLPVLLSGLALVYGGVGALLTVATGGVGAVAMVAGIATFAGIAWSLGVLADPMSKIAKTAISVDHAKAYGESVYQVVKGFAKAMGEINIFDYTDIKLIDMIANSSYRLGSGLGNWKSLLDGWNKDYTNSISDVITGVTTAMFLGTSPDYIEKRYGVSVSRFGMWQGIKFTMGLGDNLRELAHGINAWRDMQLNESDAQTITNNIETILGVLPYSVARVGKLYDDDDGFTNLWGLLEKTDTRAESERRLQWSNGEIFSILEMKRGLKYTRQIGDVLQDLAVGIKYWKEATISDSDVNSINSNITSILGTLPGVIAKVGKVYADDEDDFSNLWGLINKRVTPSDDNAVLALSNGDVYTRKQIKLGIKYSQQIGDVLESLARGVKYWKDAKISESEVSAIGNNVNTILATIPAKIAQLGQGDGSTKHVGFLGLWSKTDTQRGIDYVKDIGSSLVNLASGVKSWKENKLTDTEIKTITDNVTGIITTIPSVFAKIGRSDDTDEGFLGMMKSDAEKGIQVVQALSDPLGNISNVVMQWKDVPDPAHRANSIGEGVRGMIKQTVDGLNWLNADKLKTFQQFIDPFKKFTAVIANLAKEIKNVGNVNWREIEGVIDAGSRYTTRKIHAETTAKIEYEREKKASIMTSPTPFMTPGFATTPTVTVKKTKQEEYYESMIKLLTEKLDGMSRELLLIRNSNNELNNKITSGNRGLIVEIQ